jgi:hypothetical protein
MTRSVANIAWLEIRRLIKAGPMCLGDADGGASH